MYDDFNLNGAQRGYKQSGKHLLPQDADAANDAQRLGMRNQKARRQAYAQEFAYYSRSLPASRIDKKVDRCTKLLSTRRRKQADKAAEAALEQNQHWTLAEHGVDWLGRAQNRYVKARMDAYYAAMAEQADDELLSYAR